MHSFYLIFKGYFWHVFSSSLEIFPRRFILFFYFILFPPPRRFRTVISFSLPSLVCVVETPVSLPAAPLKDRLLLWLLCWAQKLRVSDSLQPRGLQPTGLLCLWGFFRQEYWSELPFPSPGDLPDPRIECRSSALQADSLPSEPPGKPKNTSVGSLCLLQGILPTQAFLFFFALAVLLCYE